MEKKLSLGQKVKFNRCRFVISAFLNADNSLSVEPTDWALLSIMEGDGAFSQYTVHISLIEPLDARNTSSSISVS